MQAHLKVIWSQPSMKCESGLVLRKILETTNEHLRALEELGEPTHAWNSLLIFWITEKLDNESKKTMAIGPSRHRSSTVARSREVFRFPKSSSRTW